MRHIFALLMLLASTCGWAQVHEYSLKNGMKLFVKPDTRAPVAVVMLWYDVGSADELPGKTGLAHALEHMMFKGTRAYPPGYFSKTVAGIGGQENAFTNTDYTAYFEKVAADQLPTVLKLEAERMRNLIIDKEEFAKEIKVIREERRMRTDDNPQGLLYERFQSTAHLAAPYQHPVIGWMSDLHQMRASELEEWYKQYYAPNNARLVVVGDVQPDKIYAMSQSLFGDLQPGKVPARKVFPEPPLMGKKTVRVKAPAKMPMLMMGYTVPSVINAKDRWKPYALVVLSGVLSGGDSARFSKHLIRGTQSASEADAYYNPFARYATQFIFVGTPSTKDGLATMEKDMLKEIARIRSEKISDAELARVKQQLIAQKVFEKDSIFGQAMEIGLLETVGAGWRTGDRFAEKLRAVTAEQVLAVAKEYFVEDRLTRAELIPLVASERKPS